MMRNVTIAMLIAAAGAGTVHGRGFGGFHGGGYGGGGFGGFHGGGFGGGGYGGGGFHAGGFRAGGFRGGGFGDERLSGISGGGFGGGGFGAGGGMDPQVSGYRQRFGGELPSFIGSGAGGLSAFDRGLDSMPRRSNVAGTNIAAERGGEIGGLGTARQSSSQLNSFLGLPTDMGLHTATARPAFGYSGSARGLAVYNGAATDNRGVSGAVARGPNGAAGVSRAASGTAVRGPEGNVAARGSAVTRSWSAADMRVQGNYVRNTFNNFGAFNRDWVRRYPDTWWSNSYSNGIWAAATWTALSNWFSEAWPPISYDYGDELTYFNNNVYLDDQPIATSDQYYQSAAALAQTGEQANIPSEPPSSNDRADPANAKWLPLGVFEALRENEKSSTMMFQLAVNKAGMVRGNYFNTSDKVTQPLQGAVDKKTQRISWIVEDQKKIIFDTGLYNLTKDEAAVLVHFGKDKTEQWLLVRLKQNSESAAR